jgi:predicted regulator of Ras-like GTPase activity (Roadblock/LC7/MglB family)
VRAVDAAQALAELREISSEIEAAAIADDEGNVVAATPTDGDSLAAAGRTLLAHAAQLQGREPARVAATTAQGSVFVIREGGRTIVASTVPRPSIGLVFYDLKNCLRDAS